MLLLCHGGKCCGIKHIYGFSNHPQIGELPALKGSSEPAVRYHGGVQSEQAGQQFFIGKAPKETALKRLDRYLRFCQTNQPKGLIEVSLVLGQKNMWEKILLERGFELVQKFENSNTDNTIYLYHRINPWTPPKKKKRK